MTNMNSPSAAENTVKRKKTNTQTRQSPRKSAAVVDLAAGKARKVSVSMPQDLTAAVQERVGPGAFSSYVTQAVSRQLEQDLLSELSEELETEHGPVSGEALAEARAAWPDAQ